MTNQLDEMKILQSLGADLDAPAAGPPAKVRRQVMAASRRRRLIRLPATHSAVPSWRPAIAVGMAAAVAVGMWASPIGDRQDRPDKARVTASPGSTFAQPVNAAAVLHNASLAALRAPDQVPGPKQFIFSESTESGALGYPLRRQVWYSVDGNQVGLLRSRPSAGGSWTEEEVHFGKDPESGHPDPWYIADLPTDAEAMLDFLYESADAYSGRKSVPNEARNDKIWKNAQGLIADRYMRPESRAALFGALAKLPGSQVVKDVADSTGRRGVAVGPAFTGEPVVAQLVFDAKTYEFLAVRHVDANGKFIAETAYLRLAIVDKAGDLP